MASPDTHAMAVDLRVLLGKMRRRLREESNLGGLSPTQLAVLGRLDRDGPTTITALANAEKMRSQSMGANIAALEKMGLLSPSPHPTDGRQTIWNLTPECVEWVAKTRAIREDWFCQAIESKLTVAEREQLAAAIQLLQRIADT